MTMVWHVEIPAQNLERAIIFYQGVFNVTLRRDVVDDYAMAFFPVPNEATGASLALAQGDVYVPGKSGPLIYLRTDDIDTVLARAVAHGGVRVLEKIDLGAAGFVAEFQDSEGNRIGLAQPV